MSVKFRTVSGIRVLDYPSGSLLPEDVIEYIKSTFTTHEVVYRAMYNDRYCVSTMGSVYAKSGRTSGAWREMKILGDRYKSVMLTVSDADLAPGEVKPSRGWLLHRLVMSAFYGPPPSVESYDVRHLDGDPNNNRLSNLAYGTKKENMADIKNYKIGEKHQRVPTTPNVTNPKPIYTLDAAKVEEALRTMVDLKLTLIQFSTLLGVTRAVAQSVLTGEFFSNLRKSITPDQTIFEHWRGREGESNHKAKFSEIELIAALQSYVDNHWSSVQFADALGIKQLTAHVILSGRHWKHVPRPEGFAYPWPDAQTMNAKKAGDHPGALRSNEEMQEIFARVVAGEYDSAADMIQKTGMRKGLVYGILRQSAWPSLERPAGFAEAASKLYTRKSKDPEAQ